jgi:hypothetical protein
MEVAYNAGPRVEAIVKKHKEVDDLGALWLLTRELLRSREVGQEALPGWYLTTPIHKSVQYRKHLDYIVYPSKEAAEAAAGLAAVSGARI